jgi:anaerobic magnesium-protoporphyrin IX monomethyl ester cyclase
LKVTRAGEGGGSGKFALVYPEVKSGVSGCNPPYALVSLATSLIGNRIDARIFDIDAYGGDLTRLFADVASFSPDVIGMPVFYTSFSSVDKALKCIHEQNVGGTVILGGPEVAADPENVFNCYPSVRFCLAGEADLSLSEFVRRFLQGGDVFDIPGLAYRDGTTIRKNPPQLIADLSTLPVPDHGLLKGNYARNIYWRAGARGATAIIVSSRGCPYQCRFCFKVASRARYRDAASVHAEIEQIASMGIRNIHFMDDLLVVNLKRVKEIFDPIDPKLGIRFKVRARVDSINDEIVEYLASKGVREIACGFESGSAKMLALMNKRTSPEQNCEAVRIIKKHGLKVFADIFFMYPGETRETVDETLKFLWEARPTYAMWGIFVPFSGTPIVAELKEKGLIEGQFSLGQRPRVRYDYMSEEEHKNLLVYIKSGVQRYNTSLSGVLLPNLFDVIRSSGVKQYKLMFSYLLRSAGLRNPRAGRP